MLAPVELLATARPAASSARLIIRVVVVFPFVPVTSTTRRPDAVSRKAFGRNSNASRAPITAPSPRPVARDNQDAARPSPHATLAGTTPRRPLTPISPVNKLRILDTPSAVIDEDTRATPKVAP